MNPRPLGYEPSELPNCSTPRRPTRIGDAGPWLNIAVGPGLPRLSLNAAAARAARELGGARPR